MEKIYLKPTAQEVLQRGDGKEGYFDLFTYDFESDPAKRKFGNLFVLGNLQNGSPEADTSYAVNLVASLAKREYYNNPDSSPKESFSSALKKINDVIEEFFKNKDTRINIGIFAIAGENILISKLGKFKIVMARDGKNIDILNNIALFDKEETQEKEFSNIVSGKIHEGDRLWAFYPSRSLTAREKTLKAELVKADQAQFVEKLNSLKSVKSPVCCASFHIDIQKTKEEVPAYVAPQPPELDKPVNVTPEAQVILASQDEIDPTNITETEEKPILKIKEKSKKKPEPKLEEEAPHIIPAEFALGRKDNSFVKVARQLRFNSLPSNRKFATLGVGIMLLIGVITLGKSILFSSPEKRQLNAMIQKAETDLKLARSKASQNDISAARVILINSIATVSNSTHKDSSNIKTEIYNALDQLDQAQEVSPSMAESLPDSATRTQALLKSEWQKVQAGEYGITDSKDVALYENNLYILGTTITKIADVPNSKPKVTTWLKEPLAPEVAHIVVDGDVFAMNQQGLLTKYYKGQKQAETNTNLSPSANTVLLTEKDAPALYLVHKTLGRIYEINKETGKLDKTLKLGAIDPISDPIVAEGKLFFTTPDLRLWSVSL